MGVLVEPWASSDSDIRISATVVKTTDPGSVSPADTQLNNLRQRARTGNVS
jgi:hypothetical protein